MSKKVCVIGAGVSGLCAIKELVAEGHTVECFEASQGIGGAFAGPENDANRVYTNLYLTISNYYMAFSDFPPKDGWKFWTGPQYLDYLRDFAHTFDLLRHISFNSPVVKVDRVPSSSSSSSSPQWTVTIRTADGTERSSLYDAVAVCCGTHQQPRRPPVEGADEFRGHLEHSYRFREPSAYRGKRVAVVGIGESSADIVREVSNVASDCHLVVKRNPMCLPRLLPDGHPADSMTCRLFYRNRDDSLLLWALCALIVTCLWLPAKLLGRLRKWSDWKGDKDAMDQELGKYFDINTPRTQEAVKLMADWHHSEDLSFNNKFATKNVTWLPNVLNGKIKVRKGRVVRCTSDSVVLDDGSKIEVDAILFCTGYKDEFPFLPADVAPANNDVRTLYLHAFNPRIGPSLAFIGFSRPTTGAIPACSELIARYYALLVSGKRTLPSDVSEQARQDMSREDKAFFNSRDIRSVVNPCDYMDTVAKQIGCHVSPWKFWYSPLEFLRWNVGLNCPAKYRLAGPHSSDASRKWFDEITISVPTPALCILVWYKFVNMLGFGTGDFMVDLRHWLKVEPTLAIGVA